MAALGWGGEGEGGPRSGQAGRRVLPEAPTAVHTTQWNGTARTEAHRDGGEERRVVTVEGRGV